VLRGNRIIKKERRTARARRRNWRKRKKRGRARPSLNLLINRIQGKKVPIILKLP
jgi:hypothetical protein